MALWVPTPSILDYGNPCTTNDWLTWQISKTANSKTHQHFSNAWLANKKILLYKTATGDQSNSTISLYIISEPNWFWNSKPTVSQKPNLKPIFYPNPNLFSVSCRCQRGWASDSRRRAPSKQQTFMSSSKATSGSLRARLWAFTSSSLQQGGEELLLVLLSTTDNVLIGTTAESSSLVWLNPSRPNLDPLVFSISNQYSDDYHTSSLSRTLLIWASFLVRLKPGRLKLGWPELVNVASYSSIVDIRKRRTNVDSCLETTPPANAASALRHHRRP